MMEKYFMKLLTASLYVAALVLSVLITVAMLGGIAYFVRLLLGR